MGKAEGNGDNWHGHVTALTVAPEYRRLGLAAKLMSNLEEISEKYLFYYFLFYYNLFCYNLFYHNLFYYNLFHIMVSHLMLI